MPYRACTIECQNGSGKADIVPHGLERGSRRSIVSAATRNGVAATTFEEVPMRRKRFAFAAIPAALLALLAALLPAPRGGSLLPIAHAKGVSEATPGSLITLDDEGKPAGLCPLKHTDVKASISGFLARVTVTQEFENPYADKIEAVYTFPLPQDSAVDDMTILVGDRTIRGKIKEREEARQIYEAARNAGYVAALLDQERPNIFTQSVANIEPGKKVTVTISYVETLKYEEGSYEFSFPMVVGPRYIPGNATGKSAGGWAPDTDQVRDASRITPPVTPEGTRAGHDISIAVSVDAGVPIQGLDAKLHDVITERPSPRRAELRLAKKAVIPNKDFVLNYEVAGKKIEDTILTHFDGKTGFFAMILQPPERVTAEDVTPKELVFVLDTSGSMSGFPIEKAKETMNLALEGLYPRDTFNLITFAGDTHVLFPSPVPATPENLRKAQEFLASRQGGGGTEMMRAIRMALDPSDSQEHVRIVCFMTDGYIGNDMAILGEIQKHPNARIFSFGIGNSVNRFLLDKMAEHGRGEVEYVTLQDNGSAAARRFHERVRNPLLTDISIGWGQLAVSDIYPKRIPDLFSAKPVVLTGRYTSAGRAEIVLRGKMSGRDFERRIPVSFSSSAKEHDVLSKLWARTRIDDLMASDYAGIQQGSPKPEVKQEITQLGIAHRLMTQFTSFVAVEEQFITEGGKPRRVEVPVEMPEGVSYDGVFGAGNERERRNMPVAGLAYKSVARGAAGGFFSTDTAAVIPPIRREQAQVGQAESLPGSRPVESDETVRGDRDRRASGGKLHVALVSVFQRHQQGNLQLTPQESRFVQSGKVAIEVWLTDATPEVLLQLRQLGFEQLEEPKVAKILTGRIDIAKLLDLARLSGVRYVNPLTR
jgi:Ca-activated chloride channel family protein